MRDHLHPRGAFSTTYALKDITYALELAADAGIGARGAALVREVLAATQEAGWGAEYFPCHAAPWRRRRVDRPPGV